MSAATLFDAPAEIAYASPRVTLWHARSEELVPAWETESVDLVVTDPPYGGSFTSNRRAEAFGTIDGDDAAGRETIAGVLAHCVRLVGQHRHLYVFGPTDVVNGLKVGAPAALVWDKGTMSGGDLTSPWGPAHEPITFAVSKHRHGGETGRPNLPARMRKGSVLRFPRPTGRKVRHPNEKPVPLLRELIESSSRAGDLVLDPYAGSGSTGVAAILTGRRATLVESDPRWVDLAVHRLTEADRLADAAEETT